MNAEDLFSTLCSRLNAQPDSHGEAHVPCPNCGKEPKPGQVHFSFSVRGGYCMVCGEAYSLPTLARIWGQSERGAFDVHEFTPIQRHHPADEVATDIAKEKARLADFDRLATIFAKSQDALPQWLAYKRVPDYLVEAYRLGYGAYPQYTSKCSHRRLQVPLVERGQVIGFRSRSVGCDCAKWLSPVGSRTLLYNGERLTRGPHNGMGFARNARVPHGDVLYIVENPVDAILLEHCTPEVCAVATLGVTMWQPEWTELVVHAKPALVVVAYDNDRPGNGGGIPGRDAWLRDHPKDIVPNGVKLVNALLTAGVNARLFPWADSPIKADIGDLITGGD
jgi:hypothetical protein